MKSLSVIADRNIPYLQGVLEPYASVIYLDARDFTLRSIAGADALLVRTRTRCDKALLEGSRVCFIGSATTGYDHIDTDYCGSRGIRWANAPGSNADSVVQYMASVLASLTLRKGISLKGKTIGIVGVGNIGSKVATLAELLGMKVLLNDPPREREEGSGMFVPLDELLTQADMVSLHVPLSLEGEDKTFHLFGCDILMRMKTGSVLINTARGEVIDRNALKEQIISGRFLATAFDVWENEPSIDRELLAMTDIATPHIAGYSLDGKANATAAIVRRLAGYFDLPLTDWMPAGLPQPANPVIKTEDNAQPSEVQVLSAIFQSYDVMEDDARLRADPAQFEDQRISYPPRREFPAYSISLKDKSSLRDKILSSLGFQLILPVQ